MSGKPSHALYKALELLRAGYTGLAACKAAGLSPSSLYRSPAYAAVKKELAETKELNTIL